MHMEIFPIIFTEVYKNNHFKGQNGAEGLVLFFHQTALAFLYMYLNVSFRSISAKKFKYITVGGSKFHLAVIYKNRHVVHVLMCASPCIQYYFGAGKCLRDSFPKDPYLQGFVFIYL